MINCGGVALCLSVWKMAKLEYITSSRYSRDTGLGPRGICIWLLVYGAISQSVSYFTVPPRAHPSTGLQSGSATPGRTQVPSTRSRGHFRLFDPHVAWSASGLRITYFLSRGMYPHGKVLSKEYTRPEHEGTRNMVSTCSPFTWNALPQRARTALCAIPILCIPVEPPTPAPHAVSLSTTLNGQRPRTFPFAFR